MPVNVPRIRTEVQVMFFDTDCGGVVSNIAYLRFIEIARTHLAEELGLALVEMAERRTYPVVVRTEIHYRRAAKLGDRLLIEAWLDRCCVCLSIGKNMAGRIPWSPSKRNDESKWFLEKNAFNDRRRANFKP